MQQTSRGLFLHMCQRLLLACVVSFGTVQAVMAADDGPSRHALVIGNAQYNSKPLANPAHDAQLMADTLGKLGFKVTTKVNLSRKDLFDVATHFSESLPEGALSFVFFAGHGFQIGGANYLAPIELVPTSEQGIAMRAYPLNDLMERLRGSKAAVNLVILDACRNNPFIPESRYRAFKYLGLARTVAPRGTLVAYSTGPGHLAEDGVGAANSYYTATLAVAMLEPAKPIEMVLKEVAERVRRKTLDDQQPWFESSIVDELYLLPPQGTRVVVPRPMKLAEARTSSSSQARGLDPQLPSDTKSYLISPWFLSLSEQEWTQLDWEIQQRVKRMTPDELPELIHKGDGGNLVAQTTLGIVYRDGVEKATDPATGKIMRFKANNTEGLKWLRSAAEADFPVAQVELGEMYYQGHAVDRDLTQARAWLEKAAKNPYPRPRLDLLQLNLVDKFNVGKPATIRP